MLQTIDAAPFALVALALTGLAVALCARLSDESRRLRARRVPVRTDDDRAPR